MDQHYLNWPHEERLLIADALARLLEAKTDETIRASIGNMDELQEAAFRLGADQGFRPDHFDRREVNRRLKQYAAGDKEWMWE